jgi:hypothetical protein
VASSTTTTSPVSVGSRSARDPSRYTGRARASASRSALLVAHRLTSEADLDALARARPVYLDGSLADRLPTETGDVVVVDDATETVHAASVRERATPHDGESPSVRDRVRASDDSGGSEP